MADERPRARTRLASSFVPIWVLVVICLVATFGWGAVLVTVLAVPANEGARIIFPSVNVAFGAIISGAFAVGILGRRRNGNGR